jgi:hypothetical protein
MPLDEEEGRIRRYEGTKTKPQTQWLFTNLEDAKKQADEMTEDIENAPPELKEKLGVGEKQKGKK